MKREGSYADGWKWREVSVLLRVINHALEDYSRP
jgi:hypothetical protein